MSGATETQESRPKWQLLTSWDGLESIAPREGIEVTTFPIGEPGSEKPPIVVRMVVAPGVTVQPHSHVCDYTEILLEGSEQVTRKWHHAGDVRVVKAGTVYGPLVAGPEGVTKLIIFKDDRVRAVYAGQERPADDDDLRLPMPAPWSETRTSSD